MKSMIESKLVVIEGIISCTKANTVDAKWAPRNRKYAATDLRVIVGNPNASNGDEVLRKAVCKATGEKYTPNSRKEYYNFQINDSNTKPFAQRIRQYRDEGSINGKKIVVNPDGTTNMWIAIAGYVHEKPGKDSNNPFLNIGYIRDVEVRIVDQWDELNHQFCPKSKLMNPSEWAELCAEFNSRKAVNKVVIADTCDDIID